jgi:hypothetical protein
MDDCGFGNHSFDLLLAKHISLDRSGVENRALGPFSSEVRIAMTQIAKLNHGLPA